MTKDTALNIIINRTDTDSVDYKTIGWNRALNEIYDRINAFGMSNIYEYIDTMQNVYEDLRKTSCIKTRAKYLDGAILACKRLKQRLKLEEKLSRPQY